MSHLIRPEGMSVQEADDLQRSLSGQFAKSVEHDLKVWTEAGCSEPVSFPYSELAVDDAVDSYLFLKRENERLEKFHQRRSRAWPEQIR